MPYLQGAIVICDLCQAHGKGRKWYLNPVRVRDLALLMRKSKGSRK